MAPTRTIADSTGAIGGPLVVLDNIAAWSGAVRSTATWPMPAVSSRAYSAAPIRHAEGGRHVAHPGRRRLPRTRPAPHGAEAARRVNEIMAELGGMNSIVGSIIWHVVGLEWSMRRWALESRRHNESVAFGVLIAALSALEMRLRTA